MTEKTQSFRSDVAHSLATNIIIAGLNLATGILVANLLRPAGRGELAAIFNWPTVLSVLAMLGMSESLVYYSARERDRAGRYLGTSLVLTLGASVAFVVVGWLLMPWLLSAQSPGAVTAARWFLLQVPIGAVLNLMARPLRGVGDIRGWNYLRISHNLMWLVVLIGGVIHGHPTARSLSLALVLGRAAMIPFTFLVVRHRMSRRVEIDPTLARPLLRYGLPNVLAVLPNVLNVRLDQLLMAYFLPARDLGLYVVAVSWSQVSSPALLALGTVLFPRVAEADKDRRQELAARGMRIGLLVAVALAIVALPLTEVAIPVLFGDEYRDAVNVGLILVLAAAAAGTNGIQQEALRGLGRPTAVLYSQLCGLSVTVVGLAVLLSRWGIQGAAVASLLGYTTIAIVLVFVGAQATAMPWHALVIPRRGDVRALVDQLPPSLAARLRR